MAEPLDAVTVDTMVGRHAWTTFPELAASPFRVAYEEAAQSGEPRHIVEYYEQLDRWYEARAFPQGDKLVVLYRDVAEQQRSEDDMREMIASVAEAERIVHFGGWRWDVRSGRVRWSDELHYIYGLQPGEFEGTIEAFLEQVEPDDRERVRATIERALESRQPFAFEERIVRPDGGRRTLLSQGRVIEDADGEVAALVGVCHDVVVKDLEGRILMTNAAAQRVSGISAEDSVGRRSEEILPAEVAAAQHEIEQRAAGEGEPVHGEVVTAVGGEPRTYVTVTFPLPDADGNPVELCTIATDVTAQQERESERRARLLLTEEIACALDCGCGRDAAARRCSDRMPSCP